LISLIVVAFTGPRDSLVSSARLSRPRLDFVPLSRHVVVLSSRPFGAARQLSFVGATFGGCASLWLVLVAFTGPRDRWDLLTRPFEAAHPFCSSLWPFELRDRWDLFARPFLLSRATLSSVIMAFQRRATIGLCWRSL